MKSLLTLCTRWRWHACLLAVLLGACTQQDIVHPGVSPERKHSWEVAFNRGDAAAVAALYAQDAQLVMSGSPPVSGKSAIEATVRKMIQSGVKVRIGSQRNLGSGPLAYVSGSYTVLEREGGREIETGHFVEVWSNHGGTWLIDLDVNAAGPAG